MIARVFPLPNARACALIWVCACAVWVCSVAQAKSALSQYKKCIAFAATNCPPHDESLVCYGLQVKLRGPLYPPSQKKRWALGDALAGVSAFLSSRPSVPRSRSDVVGSACARVRVGRFVPFASVAFPLRPRRPHSVHSHATTQLLRRPTSPWHWPACRGARSVSLGEHGFLGRCRRGPDALGVGGAESDFHLDLGQDGHSVFLA